MEPLSILLVDDDADIGTFMKTKLAREAPDMSFHFVEGGRECLEYIKDKKVDCILSDYQMPGMDGMKLLLMLRSQGRDIPFIFLTGQGNEEVASEAFRNGAYDYFTKETGFAHFTRITNSIRQAVNSRAVEAERMLAEKELRNNEARLNEAELIAKFGSWEWFIDENVAHWSDGLCSMFGIEPEEFGKTYNSYLDFVHPGDKDRVMRLVTDTVENAAPLSYEARIFRKDGSEGTIYVSGKLSCGEDGRPFRLFGTLQDITERRQAEGSSQLSINLLNKSNDAIFVTDPATGRFIFVNDQACRSLGYDRKKLLALRTIDIENKLSDQAAWDAHVDELRAKGHFLFEGMQGRSDGTSFPVEVNVAYMTLEEKDYMVAVARDITERKKAEEVLSTSLRQQKAILDNVPYMAWLKDMEGRFISVNETLANALGLRTEDVIGKTEYDFFDREFADKCGETDSVTIKSGRRSLFEESSITKDGNTVVLETSKTPVFNDAGVVIGLTGIARDITDKRELERERDDFYAMITHDIKSPLIAILGYVDMLTEMPAMQGEDVAPIISSISSSCGKLVGLFEDFIAISHIEAGNLKLSLFPHEVSSVIEDVLAGLGKAAQAKDIATNMNSPKGIKCSVFMDQKLMHRAVYNLVQNAVNYTPAGGTITVSVGKTACDGKVYITISVEDTGPGIPPEEQHKVFGKYYRSPLNMGVKGTGLGLFIVKRAAEAHGGRVELESEAGKGSTFRLILPAN